MGGLPGPESPYKMRPGMVEYTGGLQSLGPRGPSHPPSQHPIVGQRVVGRIRHVDEKKGYGFIDCRETHAVFSRDVFLHKRELRSFSQGHKVSFVVDLNRDGQPQASQLEPHPPGSSFPDLGGPPSDPSGDHFMHDDRFNDDVGSLDKQRRRGGGGKGRGEGKASRNQKDGKVGGKGAGKKPGKKGAGRNKLDRLPQAEVPQPQPPGFSGPAPGSHPAEALLG